MKHKALIFVFQTKKNVTDRKEQDALYKRYFFHLNTTLKAADALPWGK